MAALTGEPWRGAAVSEVAITLAAANNHRAWVSYDVNTTMPGGDQSTWEGSPGGSLTLRFRWQSNGTGSGQQAPTFATVRAMLPGGVQIGTDWSVAFPAADTEVTRTFHFDDDPMNASLGSIRSGAVELYLVWGSTGGLTPWTADSRGATTGTILATNTVNWARGYSRAAVVVPAIGAISNVAVAGAEPSLWQALDPIHIRIAFSAVTYRSIGPTISLRKPSNGAAERTEADGSQTGVNRDVSWTSTTAGNTAVVGAGMTLASETKDLRIDLAAQDFGGDNEYVWATTGHAAAWIRDTELSLRDAARITVDPQVYPTSGDLTDWAADRGALFQTQNGGSEFFNPPSSGDVENGQRVFPDVGFVGARLIGARGDGLNGLTTTIKMWDSASIGSSEGSPAHTLSRVTETRRSAAPNSTPEAGWIPQEQTGVNRDKLPITWSTVLGGTWRVKTVVTSPSALVGLENYPLSSGGATWNRNLFMVTSLPNVRVILDIHPENFLHHGTHLTLEDELVPVAYMVDNTNRVLVQLVEANGDRVEFNVFKTPHPTMRFKYFDFVNEVYVDKADGGTFGAGLAGVRGNAHVSTPGGDPDLWTVASHIGGAIFQPDPVYGETDVNMEVIMTYNGVPYSAYQKVELVGEKNKHNRYAFDGPGFIGFPTR